MDVGWTNNKIYVVKLLVNRSHTTEGPHILKRKAWNSQKLFVTIIEWSIQKLFVNRSHKKIIELRLKYPKNKKSFAFPPSKPYGVG